MWGGGAGKVVVGERNRAAACGGLQRGGADRVVGGRNQP